MSASDEKDNPEKLSEQQYQRLLELFPEAVIVYALDGEIIFANKRAAEVLGTANQEELRGKVVPDLAPGVGLEALMTELEGREEGHMFPLMGGR